VARRSVASVLAALVSLPALAYGQDEELVEPAPPPPAWHGWLAVGGALPLGGPDLPSGWAGAGLSLGSFGVRVEGLTFGSGDALEEALLGSLTYELGRTKRHLIMALHAGGGVRLPDGDPLASAGLHTQLGLQKRGPLVLGLDAAFHFDLSELPIDVYFVSSLSLGLSW
jgi:hypothetical protein